MSDPIYTEFKGKLLRPGRPPEFAEYTVYPYTQEFLINWPFDSPPGGSGEFYFGGFLESHGTAFTPAGGTNVGTANSSYAAHAYVVLGATSTDMVVRVTGTSIDDNATRTTSDTEDIDTSGGATNAQYETSKKWIGQVSYSLQSGTGVVINAGLSKYFDNRNRGFTITGLEATWLAGANDSGPNIELLHYKDSGWTYAAGGDAIPPTGIANLQTDHNTEYQLVNGEHGAWKRVNLNTYVAGAASEGIIWKVSTTANASFELGSLQLQFTSKT
jgi:hypothetical protein